MFVASPGYLPFCVVLESQIRNTAVALTPEHMFICCVGINTCIKKSKRKVQGLPQSQTAALPRHQEEEETEKSKQAQIEQTYEKH